MSHPSAITVFEGRLKQVQFTWKSGAAPSSTPIDLTGATCVVRGHNISVAPTIAILNPTLGICELTFSAESTLGLRGGLSTVRWVMISLTFTSNPGYSPDPVRVEVSVVI